MYDASRRSTPETLWVYWYVLLSRRHPRNKIQANSLHYLRSTTASPHQYSANSRHRCCWPLLLKSAWERQNQRSIRNIRYGVLFCFPLLCLWLIKYSDIFVRLVQRILVHMQTTELMSADFMLCTHLRAQMMLALRKITDIVTIEFNHQYTDA